MRIAIVALALVLTPSARSESTPAAPPQTNEAAACRADFSPDKMVKEIRGELGRNKWKAQLDLFAMHFVRYYQCRSHAEGKPRCGALENFHEPEIGLIGSTAKICSDNLHKDRFFYAAARKKPEARKLCVKFLTSGNDTFAPASRKRACDAWIAHWEDSKAACAELTVPGMAHAQKQEKWEKHCPETLASFYGEESYCKEFKGFTMNNDPKNPEECNDKQECTDYGAFLKASKAGDASLCGESGLCRFFMTDEPSSCGVYAKQLEDWYCGRFAWPEFANANARGPR